MADEIELETLTSRAIHALFYELNCRRGLHISDLDEDVMEEIRAKWELILDPLFAEAKSSNG